MIDKSNNKLSARHATALLLNAGVLLWAIVVKVNTTLPGTKECGFRVKGLCPFIWEAENDPLSLLLFVATVVVTIIGMWLSLRQRRAALWIGIGLSLAWFPTGFIMFLGSGMKN